MTRDDLLRQLGLDVDTLARANWPIEYDDTQGFVLVVPHVRSYPTRITLGTLEELIPWWRSQGIEPDRTARTGSYLAPIDPPYLMVRQFVDVNGRRVADGTQGEILTETRAYPLTCLPAVMTVA